jgi:hypothetical protein
MFTSQAIWMGGLPMTYGVFGQGIDCIDEDEYATTGWRYCSETQIASIGWRDHGGVTTYYSSSLNPILNNDGGIITSNLFAISEEEVTIRGNIAGRAADGYPRLVDQPNREAFYDEYFNPSSNSARRFENIYNVRQGDYIFINRPVQDIFGHGFLVVGWGEITSCPDALSRLWKFTTPSNQDERQLFADFASAGTNLVVPYVVDFSGGISFRQLQQPRPRPFYCAEHENPNSFLLNDSYAFYAFPDGVVTINVPQLYTPTEWSWEN